MTVRAPGFLSEPKVESLLAILEKLRKGALELPRFQRPFVWRDDKQIELLRSVRDGIPIGSLMIWQTLMPVTASDKLGTRLLPRSTMPVHSYLLDGQQRMATLYAALVPLEPNETAEQSAHLDLESDDFVFRSADESAPRFLPLSLLLDSIKLRRRQRELPDEVAEAWIERSDAAATAFKDYKLATITIATDDRDTAIRTFERINTQGTQMSGVHMIHALSFTDGFHLLDEMEALRQEHLADLGWGTLDDERILDVCRVRLGMLPDGVASDQLARRLKESPSVVREAVEDVVRAAKFLRAECGVRRPRLLPHRNQLLVLSAALRHIPNPSAPETGRLIAWFWASTLTGWFEGESAGARARLRTSLDEIAGIVRGETRAPFAQRVRRPLGPTLDVRWGRGRALILLLAGFQPRRASGDMVDLDALLDTDRLEIPWLLPRGRVGEALGNPGNRVLLPAHEVPDLRYCIFDSTHAWPSLATIAKSHAISQHAWSLLRRGDLRGFIDARRQDLDAAEEQLLRSSLAAFE